MKIKENLKHSPFIQGFENYTEIPNFIFVKNHSEKRILVFATSFDFLNPVSFQHNVYIFKGLHHQVAKI